MFIGGLSALLLQSLHPLAMAGVEQHSGYRGDPWGRLARTSHFLAVTTYGSAEDAERRDRRRAGRAPPGHAAPPRRPPLRGVRPAPAVVGPPRRGRQLPAGLPALRRRAADRRRADEYVAQSGRVARALGAVDVPGSVAEVASPLRAYRPELAGTPAARDAARFLVANPPLPLAPAPGVPAHRRRRRRPAAALGPLAAAPAVAPRHRGHRRARRRRARHPHDPLGPARRRRSDASLAGERSGTGAGARRVAGMDRLVLASGSPRRRELLAQLGLPFTSCRPTSTRRRAPGEAPARPRRAASPRPRRGAVDGDPVLAADTIVEIDGEILGKPADAADARRMLGAAVGPHPPRPHRRRRCAPATRLEVEVVTTDVTFVAAHAGAVDWYLATGEPFDKAGAYAIQGAGGVFVDVDPRQRQQRRRPAADHRRRPAPPAHAAGRRRRLRWALAPLALSARGC